MDLIPQCPGCYSTFKPSGHYGAAWRDHNGTRKKTGMIAETGFLLILNKQSGAVEGWCDDCDDLSGMLQPEEAATISAFRLGPIRHSFELSDWFLAGRSSAGSRVYAAWPLRPV
jgi:hypothetical protein